MRTKANNTTLRKLMQVMARVAASQKENPGKAVKCHEIANYYKRGERFFESTCYALAKSNWLHANMGRNGGYDLGELARKRGPIGLMHDFISDEDRWVLELLLKRSPKHFEDFQIELID